MENYTTAAIFGQIETRDLGGILTILWFLV
jgi:hypothetical protein